MHDGRVLGRHTWPAEPNVGARVAANGDGWFGKPWDHVRGSLSKGGVRVGKRELGVGGTSESALTIHHRTIDPTMSSVKTAASRSRILPFLLSLETRVGYSLGKCPPFGALG